MSNERAGYCEIVRVAEAVTNGSLDMLDGARALNALGVGAALPDDPLFLAVAAFESETDKYPTGELRSLYVPAYLSELDGRLQKYLESEGPSFLRECEQIATKYRALSAL